MDVFVRAAAAVLIASIVSLTIAKFGKDFSFLIVLCVCALVLLTAGEFLSPVLDFIQRLQQLGKLNSEVLAVAIKSLGIGLLAEICNLICADSGNASLGKALQVLAAAVVLCISVPLLNTLLDLMEGMLQRI